MCYNIYVIRNTERKIIKMKKFTVTYTSNNYNPFDSDFNKSVSIGEFDTFHEAEKYIQYLINKKGVNPSKVNIQANSQESTDEMIQCMFNL